jgi:peptidoglycan/LPS O-acetylase OafA/YrhL
VAISSVDRAGWLLGRPRRPWLALAAQTSYCLFLVHFPVCLVVMAWLSLFVDDSPLGSLAGMFLAYSASVLASFVFYAAVERRFR